MTTDQVRTGFDIEVLLGAGYFMGMFRALHQSGTIPNVEGQEYLDGILGMTFQEPASFTFGVPHTHGGVGVEYVLPVRIRYEKTTTALVPGGYEDIEGVPAPPPIEVENRLTKVQDFDLVFDASLKVTAEEVRLSSTVMRPSSLKELDDFGDEFDTPRFSFLLHLQLVIELNRSEPLNVLPSNITHLETRVLEGSGDRQQALALYFNFELELEGLYENSVARILVQRCFGREPQRVHEFADTEAVEEYIAEYNEARAGTYFAPLIFILPEQTADLENWDPHGLIILPDHQPRDMVGWRIAREAGNILRVYDKDGNELDRQAVADAGEHSIIGHLLGNLKLGSLEYDSVKGLVVKYKDGNPVKRKTLLDLQVSNPPRGNAARGTNFLPLDRDFAIGINERVVKRFEKDMWNRLPYEKVDGRWRRVVKDGNKRVGHFKDLDLYLKDGSVVFDGDMVYYLDNWFDPDVSLKAEITPSPDANGDLSINHTITEQDVDMGIVTIVLAVAIGALFGGLFGALGIFGAAAGAMIGATIGSGVVGVLYAVADHIADGYAGAEFKEQLPHYTGSLFNAIPPLVGVVRLPIHMEACYETEHGVKNLYRDCLIDKGGIIFSGEAGYGTQPAPNLVTIVDRGRMDNPGGWELAGLTYQNIETGQTSRVVINNIGPHLRDGKLVPVVLYPKARYMEAGRIYALQFHTGVDLRVTELYYLTNKGAVHIPNTKFVKKSDATVYIQSVPDGDPDNNLLALPTFTPVDP